MREMLTKIEQSFFVDDIHVDACCGKVVEVGPIFISAKLRIGEHIHLVIADVLCRVVENVLAVVSLSWSHRPRGVADQHLETYVGLFQQPCDGVLAATTGTNDT